MISAPSDDLILAIDAHLRSLITERGDEQFAHVSDCFGCDRAVWERRQPGFVPRERDAQACLKMQLGVEIERHVCDGLQADYEARGWLVTRDAAMAWDPNEGRGSAEIVNEQTSWALENEMVGHIDLGAEEKPNHNGARHVLEIKSTSFLKGRVPLEPSPHYVEQAATYGIAVGATHCGIIIVCRESGRIAGPFWLDLDALEFATIERAKQVIEATHPDAFPPEAKPRYAWQPRYCLVGDCPCAKQT